MWLKQSTSVVISFGPFLDKTDGNTLETGLVSALDHASTGIMLSKNGGTLAVRHATVTASSYDAYGNYKVTLDTTDTGTLGTLRMQYTDNNTTALPVWQDFMVVPAMIYDSLIAGSDRLDTNVTHVGDTAQTAYDIGGKLGSPAGASVSADIATVAGYIDTEVSAIKAKTDLLTFTVSGFVDANIQYVNDVAVTGAGTGASPWGP
jgi:hypothetical protein